MGKISSYLCGVWSDIASVPRLTCESAREMRDVRSLAGSSMLTALSVVLNPLWLSIMFGDAFIALVSMRLVKNIVMFPIEVGLLYFLLKKTGEIYSRARSSGYYAKKSQ